VNRVSILALLLVGAASCYNPSIRNQGYACDPTEEYSCPVGFRCIDGLCDDGSGGHPRMNPTNGDDMATGSASDDMAMTPGGDDMARSAPADQATASPDMAQAPPDLAHAPPDMAQSCTPLGGSCINDSDCCSQWCNWSTDRCVKHP
jgi:hypothetical protein